MNDYRRLKQEAEDKMRRDKVIRILIWISIISLTLGISIMCAGMYMFVTGR